MPELKTVGCMECGQVVEISPSSVAWCSRDHQTTMMIELENDDADD